MARRIPSSQLLVFLLWICSESATDALAAPKVFGSKPPGASKQKKKAKKRASASLARDFMVDRPAEPTPKLDKWGLPPPTLEDIFPPLSDDVELRPARSGDNYTLDEIQSALGGYMDLDLPRALQANCKVTLVHEFPPVLVLDDFLAPDECREIQSLAGLVEKVPGDSSSSSAKSPIKVQSARMSQSLAQSVRTSTSWFCHYASVSTLMIKMEELLGISLSNIEEPQIVQYKASQEFSWHYDHLPPAQLNNGGQRIATVLVYLNDCPQSPTVFRDLHPSNDPSQPLAVAPVTGRALIFFPADALGVPDERTLHCGRPAVSAEKHLIQCWIHQTPYTAVLPPGNQQSDVDRVGVRQQLGYE